MRLPPKNQWQMLDPKGDILPWYTFPFLEKLQTFPLNDWDVFEYGCGYSTLWYARNCRSVTSVEHDIDWCKSIRELLDENGVTNYTLNHFPTAEHGIHSLPGDEKTPYVSHIATTNKKYDLIVIDGSHRNACCPVALAHIKPGGIIIYDNWEQPTCDVDVTDAKEWMKDYQIHVYKQPNHIDWKTAYWEIK